MISYNGEEYVKYSSSIEALEELGKEKDKEIERLNKIIEEKNKEISFLKANIKVFTDKWNI